MKAVSREGMLKASGKGSIADSSKLLMSHGNLNMRKCRFAVWSRHDSDTERVRRGSEQACDVQYGVLFFLFFQVALLWMVGQYV